MSDEAAGSGRYLYESHYEAVLPYRPALVWALVADTNRFDRAAGLLAGRYRWEQPDPNDPSTRQRVASAKQFGLDIAWVEPPYEWVEGRAVRGRRDFVTGPISEGGFRVDLEPYGAGTRVFTTGWARAKGLLTAPVALAVREQLALGQRAYVQAIASLLAEAKGRGAIDEIPLDEPSAAYARRALLSTPSSTVASGPITPASESDLAYRASRLERAPVEPALRERLLSFVRERPDDEVMQVRPFELARAWGADRREVLSACLHAARAGVFDLVWELNCPTCRVASDSADSLSSLKEKAHCEACNIDFSLDFSRHVEAVFRVNRAVRAIEPAVYCESSPWFRPHVFAQFRTSGRDALGAKPFYAVLPSGEILVRARSGKGSSVLTVDPAAPPAELLVRVTDEVVEAVPSGQVAPGKPTLVKLESHNIEPRILLMERTGWSADAALGSVVATLPDFLDLFASDAPATGVELAVSSVALLFSDLTGSTAMYERVGDARAFALVNEHFDVMSAAVAANRGAVVKTMGDAVMASFESPRDALAASFDMILETAKRHTAAGLSVKLGVHDGACLAVRANDRLDYFGTTVNVAARLQAKAAGGEVVIAEELLTHPGVSELLRERGYPLRRFMAELKGIKEKQPLVAVEVLRDMDARVNPEAVTTGA